jgi:hypothetical protein
MSWDISGHCWQGVDVGRQACQIFFGDMHEYNNDEKMCY